MSTQIWTFLAFEFFQHAFYLKTAGRKEETLLITKKENIKEIVKFANSF